MSDFLLTLRDLCTVIGIFAVMLATLAYAWGLFL